MKKTVITLFLLLLLSSLSAQQISGNLKNDAGQQLTLYGYKGFKTIKLGATTVDSSGNFTIKYQKYSGMGFLKSSASHKSAILLVLNEDSIYLKGKSLQKTASLNAVGSEENRLFKQYAVEHKQREAVYAAWEYLLKQYKNTGLLKKQIKTIEAIENEINRLETADSLFLKNIDTSTYVSWYLPIRKLIDDMPASAIHYPERIPENIADFRHINFNDKRLYYSGLYNNLLKEHYWLIENAGLSLDSMYVQMNLSTDYIIRNLQNNDSLLNKVGIFLFHLFEQRSLFKASEHLALKMLTQDSAILEPKIAKQLEAYRIMKVGNIAPDIDFKGGVQLMNGKELTHTVPSLSKLHYDTTLVIFGAGWCPKCRQEIPKALVYYDKWKAKGLHIVFISLDYNKEAFIRFSQKFPWLSYCDMKGWDSKIVNNYYVYTTPTLFLLDGKRKILLRPVSLEQVNAWVEQNMR